MPATLLFMAVIFYRWPIRYLRQPKSVIFWMPGKAGYCPAILATFDDGDVDFYGRALALLQKYHYPASLATVGSWLEEGLYWREFLPLISTV
ncbi:MAG: polysaccharide deacetylase family protein [Methylomonas sp.]|jgi:peptidoglycan/xylan/chitin deacetylase (PgdA/CDA1 family)|uniref:polysaccharide deacetylase family protein n=1 Tax=Methylomonas sp. TaxID=418 RepID=UPI0025CED7A8|nr:polysaccharide deacetylase family protein [Methylomonas sp.]MCK9605045.1 polysaccharide deacetylase family protein [Methylomonas sp.]